MAISIDLQPSPQFDKSLVPYNVINFGRIRDALLSGRKRISSETISVVGPWSKAVVFAVPYLCDIVLWTEISWYSNAPGSSGMWFLWDGANLPIIPIMWFNEAYSHKPMACTNVIRGVARGTHTLTQLGATGGILSDSGDRLRISITYYEL